MFKTVKEFLKDPNPAEYDFKNEYISEAEIFYKEIKEVENIKQYIAKYKKIKDNDASKIKRFMQYVKALDVENPIRNLYIMSIYACGKVSCDCDSSDGSYPLTDEIYNKLWGWHFDPKTKERITPSKLKEKLGESWNYELGCDTMNSFKTTYEQAIKIYSKKPKDPEWQFESANDNPYLQEFARATHRIGNFTLIPHRIYFDENKEPACFQSRGTNGAFRDYWDLSLNLLKDKKNMNHELFEKYIDTFFLNDYVEDDGNDKYKVKELFTGHRYGGKEVLPKSEPELNEYLKNVICMIKLRGIAMVDKLRNMEM